MSHEITADEVKVAFFEAAAETARANSDLNRKVTPFTIARKFWAAARALGKLLQCYSQIEHKPVVGMAVQKLEKDLAGLIEDIDGLLDMSRKKRLHERLATRGAYYSLLEKSERLKDYWVAFSSSTDPELDERLKQAQTEEAVLWDSLWR